MRVLVLGGGYGGVTLARKLESAIAADHELLVVDEDGTHLVQHELHRVVRKPSLAAEITVELDAVLERASVATGRVTSVRSEDRTVALDDGTELPYDVCAVCLGAEPALSVPGVREHATPLKRVEHARAIHEAALDVLDAPTPDVDGAERSGAGAPRGDPAATHGEDAAADDEDAAAGADDAPADGEDAAVDAENAAADGEDAAAGADDAPADGEDAAGVAGRIVVGGAGLSGVQVAGELAALARQHDRVVGEDVAIAVLEQADAVAPGFDGAFQAAIESALVERGVEVHTGARVERATADAVVLAADGASDVVDAGDLVGTDAPAPDDGAGRAGARLEHDLLVWTGGIVGSAALGGERPQVDARLRLAERTFALGDAVRAVDRDGQGVPATAQAAVRAADTVATNVQRVVEGSDGPFDPRLERFAFDSPGWVVSIGDGAVAKVGPTVFTGAAATALKTTVGVGYLSSVGALREAVDLVNQELDLAVGED